MVEELYIIKNGHRYPLDLSIPSGITLNFKSNIFSDLSKITASYSYTFKLPLTARNRRVLDLVDDIRHTSSMTHLKLRGEYIQNGIPLFENVNLYIDSVESAFNCVMTWGDAIAFGNIKNDNLKLTDLTELDDEIDWSTMPDQISSFDNSQKALNRVAYNAGVTIYNFFYDSRVGKYRTEITNVGFVPVVPVYRILQAVTSRYGISFPFAQKVTGGNWVDEEDLFDCVNKGVIPFVNRNLSTRQYEQYAVTLSRQSFDKEPTTLNGREFLSRIYFNKFEVDTPAGFGSGNGYIYVSTTEYLGSVASGFQISQNIKARITGCFRMKFSDIKSGSTPRMTLCYSTYEGYDQEGFHYSWTDVVELLGKLVEGETDLWEFDFRDSNSAVPFDIEGNGSVLYFWFSHTITSFSLTQQVKIVPIEVSGDGITGKSNPRECMPDITVIDFLKSLFFMTGTFPVFKDNVLSAVSYDVLSRNIIEGNVYDWSSKLSDEVSFLPKKTSFIVSDYANKNIYAMSTDNTDGNSNSDGTDVYERGQSTLNLASGLIATKEKTIVKLPWAAPYLLNREFPNEDTGSTIKSWVLDKDAGTGAFGSALVKYTTPKPALGIICQREISHIDNTGALINDGKVMSLRIWNDFNKVLNSSSMRYMQSILNKPIVITENLKLNEFDLKDLDFSTPVYLSKYNSYFAIVSITRDSKGVCKTELIKLPNPTN